MAAAAAAGGRGGKEGGDEGSLARRAWRQYLRQLQLHPLRTKMITAGCLAGVSDSVAQKLSGYQKIEKRRLLLKMLFGFAYGGPFGHYMHKVLDYIFKGKKDTKTVAKKVFLESVTSSPWNNLLFLFYYGYVVERRPFKEVKPRVKKQYPAVQLSAWMFWPIISWINHQYMPLQFRGDISQPSCKDHVFEAVIDSLVGKLLHSSKLILND
uniref:Peroxisomal membrane protein PMP22 n=1 Tax=Leersia perrieri TaxID=77586 RepID=A0A0D9VDY3_9ORYZ